jgi:hypothetical protein
MVMARVLALKPPFDPDAPEPLVERRGGVFLSFFFHLMLLALLFNHTVSPPSATHAPSRVHLSLAPPPPPPTAAASPNPVDPQPIPEEVRRTSDAGERLDHVARDNLETERLFRQGTSSSPAEEAESPPPAEREPPDRAENPERRRPPPLDEETRRLMAAFNDLAVAEMEQQILAKAELQGRIFEEQEKISTANADYVSDGADEGHIRELDVSEVPLAIVRQVLERYGAEVGMRPLRPDEIDPSVPHTLNAARIGDQLLTAQEGGGAGGRLWIRYGDALSGRLVDLERLEMAHRGINPSRVALTRTVFGIVRSPSGWILGVNDMEIVEVD